MEILLYFDGNIPVLMAKGKSLAEAWENSMIKLYKEGCQVRTEYDAKDKSGNFIEPPSVDATMMIVCEDPSSEPLIHRAFPGGLEDLEEYRQEVLDGIKDHWIRDPKDHKDKRWEYTYHERLTAYSLPSSVGLENLAILPKSKKEKIKKERKVDILLDQPWVRTDEKVAVKYTRDNEGKVISSAGVMERRLVINQLKWCVEKLAKVPYTRRAQAITWQPWEDTVSYDPACLQSIWLRMLRGDDGKLRLNMNVRFRSRDAYDAAFMNMFAFVNLQERLANQISELRGEEVLLGRYVDLSDSYHIYGKRRKVFEDGFLKLVETRSFEDRTWTREFANPFFEEARPMIAEKVREKDKSDKERKSL